MKFFAIVFLITFAAGFTATGSPLCRSAGILPAVSPGKVVCVSLPEYSAGFFKALDKEQLVMDGPRTLTALSDYFDLRARMVELCRST